ncbi:hypothetical protein GGR56DRAFT_11525 [Xylariaceae sp. FL0804]|nr:hypothetical protein GGR56DRAFT_11525 [Xylariaceae sp. FL0804]
MSAACIQRPRMGSSQPPDGNAPFGYNFSSDPDFPLLRAPTPPRADPLLNSNDWRGLNMFFEDMSSNQYPPSYGEGLNFNDAWFTDIAPTFLGHTTSFGQQPPPQAPSTMSGISSAPLQDIFNFGQTMMPPPPQPPQPALQHFQHVQQQHPSAPPPLDHTSHAHVAAVLTSLGNGMQNGHSARTNSFSSGRPVLSPQNIPSQHGLPLHNNPNHMDQTRSIIPPNYMDHGRNMPVRPARSNEHDPTFTDMMFGSQNAAPPRHIETSELQWGSDSGFSRAQGFVPPAHESSEVIERRRMGALKVLGINKSAANTRAASPVANGTSSTNGVHNGHANNTPIKEEFDSVAPPRKRRKSKAKEEVEEEEDLTPVLTKAPARKRKSKVDLNGAAEASSSVSKDGSGKRRKSGVSGPKPPRENLTDAQKRENHIKSEQKRREAIRTGFEDLGRIVPNLKGSGYSKSTMLTIAGEWLESLISENEDLSNL